MLEQAYPSDVKTFDDVQSGVDAYRKALGAAEDKSVTVASIGELTNLRDVVTAIPDLFSSKVKDIIYMAGESESNLRKDVDPEVLASETHGFVGSDIAALLYRGRHAVHQGEDGPHLH
jgi:inosine-uridine nucleoside N-ribohydrolase